MSLGVGKNLRQCCQACLQILMFPYTILLVYFDSLNLFSKYLTNMIYFV